MFSSNDKVLSTYITLPNCLKPLNIAVSGYPRSLQQSQACIVRRLTIIYTTLELI